LVIFRLKTLPNSWHNVQEAVAQCFETEIGRLGSDQSYFLTLPKELQAKRDKIAKLLTEVGMKPIIPQGGYFMIADASNMSKYFNLYLNRFEVQLVIENFS